MTTSKNPKERQTTIKFLSPEYEETRTALMDFRLLTTTTPTRRQLLSFTLERDTARSLRNRDTTVERRRSQLMLSESRESNRLSAGRFFTSHSGTRKHGITNSVSAALPRCIQRKKRAKQTSKDTISSCHSAIFMMHHFHDMLQRD